MTKATSVLLFRVQKIPNSLSIESAKKIGTQAFQEKKGTTNSPILPLLWVGWLFTNTILYMIMLMLKIKKIGMVSQGISAESYLRSKA